MRNLKKILAAITVIAMLASFMVVPALADSFKYEAEATTLNELGLMEGMGLGDSVNRLQGIIFALKAAGKKAEVDAMTDAEAAQILADMVVDADQVPAWGVKWVAYAVKNGYTSGVDASVAPKVKFAPLQEVSGTSFLVWIMNIGMGYKFGTDVIVSEAVKAGVITLSQAMEFGVKAALTRDDAAGILYGACKNGVNADGKAFIQSLIEAGVITEADAVAAGFVEAKPVKFEVLSMTADNLKAVKIIFSKPIDKDTATTTNISFSDGGTINEVQVSDDKTVVYAVLQNAVAQNAKVKVKIKDVKDADGNKIEESETEVYMKDLAVPEITGVVVNDAKNFEILVSEPLNYLYATNTVLGNIKIDGLNPIGTTKFDYVNNKLKVTLANAMSVGTHKIEIKDMTDFSSLKAVTKEFTIAVEADTTPPAIASVEYKGNTKLEITFTENLSALGSIKIDGKDQTANCTLDGKKVTVNLPYSDRLGIGAVVQVKIEYKDQKDVVDNKVADWTTYIFTVLDDTSLPSVSVTVEDQNKLVFKFTKAMTRVGKITVKDKDGKTVATIADVGKTGAWKDDDKTYELEKTNNGLNNVDIGSYTLVLENFKDASIRENGMPKTEIQITAKDTKVPKVKDRYTVKDDASDNKKDTITFYFSEAMDRETATNLSNYVVKESTSTPFKDRIGLNFAAISDVKVKEFANDGKSITFYFPGAGQLTSTTKFNVAAIKDLGGNMIALTVVSKIGDESVKLAGSNPVKATATNKVEVYFNSPIKTADPSAFKIQKYDGTKYVEYSTFSAFEIKNDESTTPESFKVIFTLVNAFDTSDTTNFRLAANVDNAIENIYGSKLDKVTTPEAIVDGIAPYVKEVTAEDNEVILIKLSETVKLAKTSATTDDVLDALIVTDPDGNVISKSGSDSKITKIELLDDSDKAATVAGFSRIKLTIKSDQAGKVYKVSVISRANTIVDKGGLVIKGYDVKEITIKD